MNRCIICGTNRFALLKEIHAVKIYKCPNCELGFVDKAKFKVISLEHLYNTEDYRKEEERLIANLLVLVSHIKKYKQQGSVLDIGGGFGLFSSILFKHGQYKLDLIEPSNKIIYLKDIPHNLYRANFDKFSTAKKYDIVLLMDVIEHFFDPVLSLKKISTYLRKDAIVVIQTPNYKSLMQYLVKNWSWWMIEDHKYFLTPKSLRLMIQKQGFEIIYFMTYENWLDLKRNLDGNFSSIKNNYLRKVVKLCAYAIYLPFYFVCRKIIWSLGYGGLMFTIIKRR